MYIKYFLRTFTKFCDVVSLYLYPYNLPARFYAFKKTTKSLTNHLLYDILYFMGVFRHFITKRNSAEWSDIMYHNEIRKLRKQMYWNQYDLADYLDTNQTTIWKWEKGYSLPNTAQRAKLAELLHCTVEALYPPQPDDH